jgi:hypothetical protein
MDLRHDHQGRRRIVLTLGHRSGHRRSDLAAAPRDQECRDHVECGGGDVAVHPQEEDLGSHRPDGARVLGDDGNGGLEYVAEQHVVEPDDRDPVLDADPV